MSSRSSAAVVLIAALCLAVPAGAARSTPTSTTATGADLWITNGPDGAHVIHDLDRAERLLTTADPADPRTLLTAAQVMASQAADVPAPSEPPANARAHLQRRSALGLPSEDDTEAAEEEEFTATDRWLESVPDLDGDGVADTIVTTYHYADGQTTVEARRGHDGAVLWTVDAAGDSFLQPTGDVDGDGVGDLVEVTLEVLSWERDEDCSFDGQPSSCHLELWAEFVWHHGVRDGRSGALRWSVETPGSYHYRFDDEWDDATGTYHYQEELQATNYVLAALPSGDHDGDHTADVVTDAIDLDLQAASTTDDTAGLGLVHRYTETSSLLSTTRARVVGGDDGALLAARDSVDAPGVSFLEPSGQLVGSPAPDLLWTASEVTPANVDCLLLPAGVHHCLEEERSSETLQLEALDGSDLSSAWTYEAPPAVHQYAFASSLDLDDDGAGEVWTFALDDSDGWGSWTTTVVSGATGAVLWSRTEVDWLFPVGSGDVDGDGDSDVITVLLDFQQDLEIRIPRLDGRTGATLFETSPPPEPDGEGNCVFAFTYLGGLGDIDGDLVGDVFGGSVIESYDDCEELLSVRSTSFAESGASGASIYSQASDGVVLDWPALDLTGDGVSDLLRTTYDVDAGWWVAGGAAALRLPDLAPLWERPLPADGYISGLGDVDGDGTGDVLLTSFLYDEWSFEVRLELWRGKDATTLWTVPS